LNGHLGWSGGEYDYPLEDGNMALEGIGVQYRAILCEAKYKDLNEDYCEFSLGQQVNRLSRMVGVGYDAKTKAEAAYEKAT
jgi:hypothetical protein